MSVCDGPMYTCPSFGTKPQVNHTKHGMTLVHSEDRCFKLLSGNVSIDVSKRTRSFNYTGAEIWDLEGGKVVVDNGEFDCGTVSTSEGATISENYKTVDCKFLFADLRHDCFVYEEKTGELIWEQSSNKTVGVNNGSSTRVFPFVDETVPITRTTRVVCTSLSTPEISNEVVNAGYGDGIRLLMPGWDGQSALFHETFVSDGVTYDAYDVDWYSQFDNWELDGDLSLWWPAWLRAVVANGTVDAEAAGWLYAAYHGTETPFTKTSDNGIQTVPNFSGSCAFDVQRNMFMSAVFNDGALKFSKLRIADKDKPIPKDCECDVWYPIAPL